ncbi:MAG: helix-turn-helix domain-containing protein [Kofleriaceae bacterium]|nr:helix-turn-helix domain-containing protein [Kofleriaceae bacterium]
MRVTRSARSTLRIALSAPYSAVITGGIARESTSSAGVAVWNAQNAFPGRLERSCYPVRKRPVTDPRAWQPLLVLDDDARYEALSARDPRFDGVFFVGVQTTGIYCRPICPARTPGRTRCQFFATPAQAERAGFRACFRCRPELAPGNAPVDAIDALVAVATQRIAEGALNDGTIDDLAKELGVSSRHLRRATEAKLGVSPVELAQTSRLALAKQLLQDTALPITDIAFAAGFRSVRRFNATFAERMGTQPSEIRRTHADATGEGITLRLDYRAPYDWPHFVEFLRGRTIAGVEIVNDEAYRRVVHLGGKVGEILVRPAPNGRPALLMTASPSLLPVLMQVVARVRRMFDLDAHPEQIARVLGRDKQLAPLVAKRPGLRVPGAIDPFEAAIRAMVGQQVSVAAATTIAGRFAAQLGAPYASTIGAARERGPDGSMTRGGALAYRFPTAAEVAAAGPDTIGKLGMPRTRGAAIHALATAVATGTLRLEGVDLDTFVGNLVEMPGIGPWTANYLAMRALHLPDAFPAADLGVQKALNRSGARAAEERAEAWRPFRAYAVLHLWTSLGD